MTASVNRVESKGCSHLVSRGDLSLLERFRIPLVLLNNSIRRAIQPAPMAENV